MSKIVLLIVALLAVSYSHADLVSGRTKPIISPKKTKKIIVAVIDTGISDDFAKSSVLCPKGSEDFTGTNLTDRHGHGTHIAGLIDQYAKNIFLDHYHSPKAISNIKANYCIVALKYYDTKYTPNQDLQLQEIHALRKAIDLKVDIINISGGGTGKSDLECKLVEEALKKGIKLVFAAGNENSDIDMHPYYPAACDKRITVVGNKSESLSRSPSSNYGSKVNAWEVGENLLSYESNDAASYMTGTSQATAVKTGKLVRSLMSN